MQNREGLYTQEQVNAYLLTIKKQDEKIDSQSQEIHTQATEIAYLKEEMAQLKRMIFGQKRERFTSIDDGQLSLFEVEQQEKQAQQEEITYKRNKAEKNKAKRLLLPAHLPREEQTIEPEEDTSQSKKIGEEITEILEYNPGRLFVKRYVRPKYAKQENPETLETKILIGDLPTLPIPKGNAGPGLLAHLMISKFVDHLPFYRQRQQFKREGVELAESTINGWLSATSKLLEPLYDALIKKVRQSEYLMADETPIPVLTKDKPGSTHKGYHWVYYSPLDKQVCFNYQKGRGREGPNGFLKDFRGSLQTDGYAGYNDFDNKKDIIFLACMAHARRKFDQAKDNDMTRAEYVLAEIQKLYAIERVASEKEYTFGERKDIRQQEALPVLQNLEKWLKKEIIITLPKSKIGKAIAYTLNLWPRLMRYIEDGRYEIDNNLIENSIRPVALGRKNYLFAGSHEAAHYAAMMYSFMGTCKINNVEPFAWLRHVLSVIPDHPANKLEELLPGSAS